MGQGVQPGLANPVITAPQALAKTMAQAAQPAQHAWRQAVYKAMTEQPPQCLRATLAQVRPETAKQVTPTAGCKFLVVVTPVAPQPLIPAKAVEDDAALQVTCPFQQRQYQRIVRRSGKLCLFPQALHALPNEHLRRGLVGINVLPFRIGRESRIYHDEKTGAIHRLERYKPGAHEPNNDLYLLDDGHLLNVSREHLQIVRRDDGFHVVDRKSACGFEVTRRNG